MQGVWEYETRGSRVVLNVDLFEPAPQGIQDGLQAEARPIGAAAARAFAAQGASVFVHYFRTLTQMTGPGVGNSPGEAFYRALQANSADELVQTIREKGGRAEAWEADIYNAATIPELFDWAERAFGPVEVLVNNAAHSDPDTFLPQNQLGSDSRAVDGFLMRSLTAESHDQHFAVNSRAVAFMMAEFARRHVERGTRWGRIISGALAYRAADLRRRRRTPDVVVIG